MARQNYYKKRKVRRRQAIDEEFILQLVQRERMLQPCLGGKKLLYIIKPELEKAGVSIGRDRFFELLSRYEMLIDRKRRQVRTTDSRHGFGVYDNLLKDAELTGSNQAFASDITYIRTDEGFLYLALMMDVFSRTIVGWDCSDSLEAEGVLRALSQALGQLPPGCDAIHHSDRGSQYCCGRYIDKLKSRGLRIELKQIGNRDGVTHLSRGPVG